MDQLQLDPFGRSGMAPDIYPNDPAVQQNAGTPKKFTDEQKVKAIIETYEHEFTVRKPQEAEWDRAWRRVQNHYDWSRKSRWQSKKNFPAVLLLTLQMQWELTKSIEKASRKWFTAESDDGTWQPLLDVPRDMVAHFLQNPESPVDDFLNVYYEAVFWGLITGQVYLRPSAEDGGFIDTSDEESSATIQDVFSASGLPTSIPSFGFGTALPDQGDPNAPPQLPGQKGFRLRLDALNPRYAVKDTAGRRKKRYFIHVQTLTRAEFREEATQRGWKNVEEICRETIELDSAMGSNQRSAAARDKGLVNQPLRRDQIVLHHCYGQFYNEQGEWVVDEPSYIVIANKKWITWEDTLPYWHNQLPILDGTTLKLPGNPYGKSLIGVNLDGQEARVDLNNMILDYMHQAINPLTEVDIDQVNNARPNQLATGIFPGKVLEVTKFKDSAPAVARSGMPDMSSGVWQSFGYLKQEFNEFTGFGGSAQMPRTRNRISADEAKMRMLASVGVIEQICHNLERDVLEPALRQLFLICLQKMPQEVWDTFVQRKIDSLKNKTRTIPPGVQPPPNPMQQAMAPGTPPPQPAPPEYENPQLVEQLKGLLGMTPRQRFETLAGKFRFRVSIYTAPEQRREKLEKIYQFIEVAQGMPPLAARVKWHNLGEDICECLEMDPERYLWPNANEFQDQPYVPPAEHFPFKPPSLIGGPDSVIPPPQPTGPPR